MGLRENIKIYLLVTFVINLTGLIDATASPKLNLPYKNQDSIVCQKYTKKAEAKYQLPHGILTSISKVESGRKNENYGLVAWPWTVNNAGKGLFFNTKEQMLNYIEGQLRAGSLNLDIGCMQVNLFWHSNNFDSLSNMADPEMNVDYAARFLKDLKSRHGSFENAIRHYHNSNPLKNGPYLKKVMQFWGATKPLKLQDNEILPQSISSIERKPPSQQLIDAIRIATKKIKLLSITYETPEPAPKSISSPAELLRSQQPHLVGRWDQIEKFRNLLAAELTQKGK